MGKVLGYLGEVIFYYVAIALMLVLWLANEPIGNPFSLYLIEPWVRILIMVAIGLLGFLMLTFSSNALLKILGFMSGFGAAFGAGVSLIHVVAGAIADALPNGFFGWVGLFVACSLLIALYGSVLVAGLKSAFFCIIRLDFFSALIYIMILWSGFYGVGEMIVAMTDCSVGLLVLVLIAGIPSGYAGGTSMSTGGFLDENGQLHFVSHSMGRNRVATTDGEILTKTPGGFTKRHM